MPTFSSIGLHPALRHRLVAESIATITNDDRIMILEPAATNNPNVTIGNGDPKKQCNHPNDSQQDLYALSRHRSYHTVPTPLALLNRNPKQPLFRLIDVSKDESQAPNDTNDDQVQPLQSTPSKVQVQAIPIHHVRQLRYDVAVALIQHTKAEQYRVWVVQNQHSPVGHATVLDERQPPQKRPCLYHPPDHDDDDQQQKQQQINLQSNKFVGMVSAYDLLTTQELYLSKWKFLSTSCNELDSMIYTIVQHFQPPSTLLSCFTKFTSTEHDINTIAGGIPFGYVTQISGPPSSGKTQLVLSMIARSSSNAAGTTTTPTTSTALHRTWYMCSANTSTIQTAQRLNELCMPSNRDDILQCTTFTSVSDDYQVLQRLFELESYLIQNNHSSQKEPSAMSKPVLLVIDSCSGCLRTATNDTNSKNNYDNNHSALLRTVGTTIRRMTRQYHLATILINGTVSNHHHDLLPNQPINIPPGDQNSISSSHMLSKHHLPDPSSHPQVSLPSTVQYRTTKPALGYRWNDTVPDLCLWFHAATTIAPWHVSSTSAADRVHKKIHSAIIHVTLVRHPWRNQSTTTTEDPPTSASFVIGTRGISDVPTRD
jgi:hypothetical protein